MIEAVPARHTLWLVAGFVAWSAAFVGLYALLSVGCAYGWHNAEFIGGLSILRAVLLAGFVASLVLVAGIAWLTKIWREGGRIERFVASTSYLLSLAALGSTFLTYLPAAFLTQCS